MQPQSPNRNGLEQGSVSSWMRRFETRHIHGPLLDQAMHKLYHWARRQQMATGVRYPGLRDCSALAGEVQSDDAGSDHPGDAALPTVLVEDASFKEPEPINQMLERELAPERRRGLRVPLQRLVRLSDGERFVTGQIVNLSATGLLIRSPALLPTRTAVAGAFLPDELGDPGQVVGFRGRVVRLHQGCVGVQLTRMTWAHRLELAALIDRRQREPRRDPTLRGWKAGG